MRQIRSKDTHPEMMLRRLLHHAGYRFRLHRKDLPGRPDLVFPSRRKIIFVHGCFWHQHPGCIDSHVPKSRIFYWKPKLAGNRRRDQTNRRELRRLGWRVLVVWECQVKNSQKLAARLERFLRKMNETEPRSTFRARSSQAVKRRR